MLYPFHKILSPLQFDEHSIAALGLAKEVAARNDATVYLLHVIPILPAIGEAAISAHVDSVEEGKARSMLEEIAKKHLADVKHEIILRGAALSETANAVLGVAKEINADLIVMTTHGRSGLPHFFMGSVTEGVMRGAACPVLTIRPVHLKKTGE
jgi:nucleotide-binding universal stress UspA family protein